LIELRALCKTFPGNRHQTLTDARWTLLPGEIHAILGENGAGKSTLMHILAGFVRPDSGSLLVNGRYFHALSPPAARKHGIGMIRQRPELCPGLRVFENCVLGAEGHNSADGIFFSGQAARRRVQMLMERTGLYVPPDAPAEALDAAGRHKAALIALLLRDARALIFDEPSAVLDSQEQEALALLMRRLAQEGRGVALITHKLDEALRLASRVTVMRNGRTLETRPARDWTEQELLARMFAAAPEAEGAAPPRAAGGLSAGEAPLAVRGLTVRRNGKPALVDIAFEVARGQTAAVIGRKNGGIEALELALCGFLQPESGEIRVMGTSVGGRPAAFRAAGGAFMASARIPLDGENGVAGYDKNLTVYDNLILHHHDKPALGGVRRSLWLPFNKKNLDALAAEIKTRARLKINPRRRLGVLSGGMLQRLILERELESARHLLVISEALWGLDYEQRRRLQRKIRQAADAGRAVVLFASDPAEVRHLCERLFFLRDGRLTEACGGGL
jgi:simple sugar transport system ATP-binding protein